ncbi:hypothetical protein HMPREF1403_00774 [Helicobacter pylori GAM201Ai]|nr:hypothetical protein HMPREF1403_00774 [Helicobacter pylori GAM201Ai]
MGMRFKKGLCLKRNLIYIEIRETALKNAYHIVGDSIKIMPTIFCDHSIKMMPAIIIG